MQRLHVGTFRPGGDWAVERRGGGEAQPVNARDRKHGLAIGQPVAGLDVHGGDNAIQPGANTSGPLLTNGASRIARSSVTVRAVAVVRRGWALMERADNSSLSVTRTTVRASRGAARAMMAVATSDDLRDITLASETRRPASRGDKLGSRHSLTMTVPSPPVLDCRQRMMYVRGIRPASRLRDRPPSTLLTWATGRPPLRIEKLVPDELRF